MNAWIVIQWSLTLEKSFMHDYFRIKAVTLRSNINWNRTVTSNDTCTSHPMWSNLGFIIGLEFKELSSIQC